MLPPPSNIRKPLLAKLKTELLQSNKSTDEWKRWGGQGPKPRCKAGKPQTPTNKAGRSNEEKFINLGGGAENRLESDFSLAMLNDTIVTVQKSSQNTDKGNLTLEFYLQPNFYLNVKAKIIFRYIKTQELGHSCRLPSQKKLLDKVLMAEKKIKKNQDMNSRKRNSKQDIAINK